jgi:hypothetical protein
MKLQYVLGLLFGIGAISFFTGCGLQMRGRPGSGLDTAAPEVMLRSRLAVTLYCLGIALALPAVILSRLPHDVVDSDQSVPIAYVVGGSALLVAGAVALVRRQMRGDAERR